MAFDPKEYGRKYYQAHKEEILKKRRVWHARNSQCAKLDVILYYSHKTGVCAHCGEGDLDVLCIDHINNDGAKQRKLRGHGGTAFYNWLIRHNYPEGHQVLCCNCNQKKEIQHRRAKSLQT